MTVVQSEGPGLAGRDTRSTCRRYDIDWLTGGDMSDRHKTTCYTSTQSIYDDATNEVSRADLLG